MYRIFSSSREIYLETNANFLSSVSRSGPPKPRSQRQIIFIGAQWSEGSPLWLNSGQFGGTHTHWRSKSTRVISNSCFYFYNVTRKVIPASIERYRKRWTSSLVQLQSICNLPASTRMQYFEKHTTPLHSSSILWKISQTHGWQATLFVFNECL